MGFFDFVGDIFEAAAPVLGVVSPQLGFAAAGVGALLGGDEEPATAKTVAAASGVLGGIQGSATKARQIAGVTPRGLPVPKDPLMIGAPCPNGSLRRRTIVETFNPQTGVVSKRETMKGAPAVMQSDVAAANRLNRQLARLNKKQPRKLVRESEITKLKNEVVESALRKARDPCPPKPC